MGATLFKEVGYSLTKLIEDIDLGEIALPDIQRPFVWNKSKVRDLFDSMYNGFPVGYLLFWANAGVSGTRRIGPDGRQEIPRLLIVDGQQRLTSLYAVIKGVPVLTADYKQAVIKIAFRPRDEHFAVADAAIERDPEFVSNITELWAGDLPFNRFVRDFVTHLRKNRDVSNDEEDHIHEALDRLRDLRSYPFTALELSPAIDEEKVAEVFVRINSQGVPLNQADFILTLLSVFNDKGRRQLEEFSRESRQPSTEGPSPFNHFITPDPDQMLRVAIGLGFRRARLRAVYALLRGRDLESGEYTDERREAQYAELQGAQDYALDLTNWHEFLKTLVRAGFRSRNMVTSDNNLLFAYILFLIGKRDFSVDAHTLREVIARWFFMSALTGRFTGSPETRMEQDLGRLEGLENADQFVSLLDRLIDDRLTRDYWEITLPNELATSSARSPSLFAYYAALNLLNAQVLFSNLRVSELFDPALKAKKSSLERHHLFPRGYLKNELGITATKDINQIANYALLEWPDNIKISDQAPSEYFPELFGRHTDLEKKRMRQWHALPAAWTAMDYNDFLEERRRLIAKVIKAGFERLKAGDASAVASSDDEPPTDLAVETEDLIQQGEGELLEFKSSARWNLHTKQQDERVEYAIAKSIAGFLNRDGGTLLVGVTDDGEIIGMENDLQLMKQPDPDRYELWLRDFVQRCLGTAAALQVAVNFPTIRGVQICRIDVAHSPEPVFLDRPKGQKTAEFWVRMGNSTRQLQTDEAIDYTHNHWK